MKKYLFLSFLFSLFFLVCFGQSSLYLRNKNYDVVYSLTKKRPNWVYYELTKKNLDGKVRVPRNKYAFAANPAVPNTQLSGDFNKSGYDRGHMMPAADNAFDDQGMKECNLYTNIMPQTPELNRGPWKSEENYERYLAGEGKKLTVFCGGFGTIGTLGKDEIDIPARCWKIVIVQNLIKHIADTLAYLFPNDNQYYGSSTTEPYKINYKDLEAGLGFDIADMTALHQIHDPAEQVKYLQAKAHEKIDKLLKERMLTKEKVLDRYKKTYTNASDFENKFSDAGIELPKDYTIDSFIGSKYDDAQGKINAATTKYLNDLSTNSSDSKYLLDKFSSGGFTSVVRGVGICPCCGLPLSFPVCGCKLLIE